MEKFQSIQSMDVHLIKDQCNIQKRAFTLYLQYISDESSAV